MDEFKTRLLATKVTETEYAILEELAARINRKPYSLLSLFVKCLLRYGDESQPVGEELQKVISMFDFNKGHKRRVGIIQKKAVAALYFVQHPNNGEEVVLVQGGRATYNGDKILRRILRGLYPKTARTLRKIEKYSFARSWIEIIEEQLSRYDIKADDEEYIRSLFSDNSRDECGKDLEPKKYKPLNKVSPYIEDRRGGSHRKKEESEE